MAKALKKTKVETPETKNEIFNFVAYARPKMPNTSIMLKGKQKMLNHGDSIELTLDQIDRLPVFTKDILTAVKPIIDAKGLTLFIGDRYGFQVLLKDKQNKSIMFSQDILGFQNNSFFNMKAFDGIIPSGAFKKTWVGMRPTSYSKELQEKIIGFLTEALK